MTAAMQWIEQAQREGARLSAACRVSGIDARTIQRWKRAGVQCGDRRPGSMRAAPSHALTTQERARILEVVNEARFAQMPPARIVPMLADEGTYIASESSFCRVLRAEGQLRHRGRSKTPQRRPPSTHVASAPGQVWCWDLTFLASTVAGRWFYLYLILDIYSRKIVGFEVHGSDSSDHAVDLLRRTALAEGIHAALHKPVLHGDNGSTVKATTVLAMLHWLGITASHSRPRVSNDNAFVESLFRTAKYCPQYPAAGFPDLEAARRWASEFVNWYNNEHRHSGIRFVTPAQRPDSQGGPPRRLIYFARLELESWHQSTRTERSWRAETVLRRGSLHLVLRMRCHMQMLIRVKWQLSERQSEGMRCRRSIFRGT